MRTDRTPSAPALRLVVATILLAALAPLRDAQAVEAVSEAEPLSAQLVAEQLALVPGGRASFGVLLRHAPHWHSYWINPGDSGLPTTLEWMLPPAYAAGAVEWPVPKRFEVGGLYNIGYDGEVLLPVSITVPADAPAGSSVHVALTLKWLACREACIPGKASLVLDLPIVRAAAKDDPRWQRAFADARSAQPRAAAWHGSVRDDGGRFVVRLSGAGLPRPSARLDAFVTQRKVFENHPPSIRRDGDMLVIETDRSEYFAGAPDGIELVLVDTAAQPPQGWRVQVPFEGRGTAPAKRGPNETPPHPGSPP